MLVVNRIEFKLKSIIDDIKKLFPNLIIKSTIEPETDIINDKRMIFFCFVSILSNFLHNN